MPGSITKTKIPALVNADQAVIELIKMNGIGHSKRGFKRFVKEFWSIVVADDLEWNWHMDVLCDALEEIIRNVARYPVDSLGKPIPKENVKMYVNKRGQLHWKRNDKLHDLIINVPPGSSKSTICTIMAPVWAWIIDPTIRIITGSHTDALATEHAVKSRDILESQKFARYFPNIILKYDKNNKTNYENTLLGQRMATSVGAKGVMGKHAHLIIIDDPIDPQGAKSQAEILNANNWMGKTLSQRKVNKAVTPTVLVMQRLATNDPTGNMLEKKKEKIKHICLPAVLSHNVKPAEFKKQYHRVTLPADHPLAIAMGTTDVYLLDKKRIGADVIAEAMVDLGSDGYAGQYDQTPVKEGGSIWRKWFIEIHDAFFPIKEDMINYGTDWDTAYTEKDANAASSFVTSGKIGHKMFIDDLGWVRKEFPELIKFMKDKPRPHYIEAKASGKSAKQVLTRNGVPAIEVKVEGGADKIARAKMSTPYAEAGMICIRKSLADRLYNDSRQGILSFPMNPDKDLADVLAQAIQRQFKGQIVTGTPGRPGSLLDQL